MKNSPKNPFNDFLEFFIEAEKLKTILRHSWTSNINRQESVAEHTWMLCLIAYVLTDSFDFRVDRLKLIKMLIIHDLAEVVTGDIPAFETAKRLNKYENELAALRSMFEKLPKKLADELLSVWQEMEAMQSTEAKLAQAIDKAEVVMQHLIADISTWDSNDFGIGAYHKDEYFDFHPAIREFKNELTELFWQKMEKEKVLDKLPPEQLRRRAQEKS